MITDEMFNNMVVKAKDELREKQKMLIEQERDRQAKLVSECRTRARQAGQAGKWETSQAGKWV